MKIVLFEPDHLLSIEQPYSPEQVEEWRGKALTLVDDGLPVAVFGLGVADGVGTAWAIIGDRAKRRPMAMHRAVKRFLPHIKVYFGLDCIRARVTSGVSAAWLERLGFTKNGAWYDWR